MRLRLSVAMVMLALSACKSATRIKIYIDNGRDVAASIRVDGAEVAVVPPHDVAEVTVNAEAHTISAVEPDGSTIDEAKMPASDGGRPKAWAFNVGGANQYLMRIVYYCTAQNSYLCNTPIRPMPFRPQSHFFEMPYTFMTALPETRTSTEQSVQAQSIEHVPVHWNHPCCRRLYKPLKEEPASKR
jgi:hypothetical protein